MLKFDKFTGINNVSPPYRLANTDLLRAENVNVELTGELVRREGYEVLSDLCHKNLWEGDGFLLATSETNLLRVSGVGRPVISASIGASPRVWYCNLPDGRTTFSNGLINGITDGTTTTGWGIETPSSTGTAIVGAGSLMAGTYYYGVTFKRNGVESGMAFSGEFVLPEGSGLSFIGLPTDASYETHVYLTSHNGAEFYHVGSTTSGALTFTGPNSSLVNPAKTAFLSKMPVGTVTAFWRGRVLVADGSTMWGSLPYRWELCDTRRDFKQFSAPITMIQAMDNGLFIGTETDLVFMQGTELDKLVYNPTMSGRVVLGSGVATDARKINPEKNGTAMVCICDGGVTVGYGTGEVVRLTHHRYTTDVTEVSAAIRQMDGYYQYLAVPV